MSIESFKGPMSSTLITILLLSLMVLGQAISAITYDLIARFHREKGGNE